MMPNVQILEWTVSMFIACLACGIGLSFLAFERTSSRLVPAWKSYLVWIALLLLSGAGGRIAFTYIYKPVAEFEWSIGEGSSFLGSVLALIVVMPLLGRLLRVSWLQLADAVALPLLLLQLFGKVGCWFAGCCYGDIVGSLPDWLLFANTRSQGQIGYPVQLFEAASFAAFLAVVALHNGKASHLTRMPGVLASSYLVFYGVHRFSFEFIRGDAIALGEVMTAGQLVGLLVTCIGFFGLRRCSRLWSRARPQSGSYGTMGLENRVTPASWITSDQDHRGGGFGSDLLRGSSGQRLIIAGSRFRATDNGATWDTIDAALRGSTWRPVFVFDEGFTFSDHEWFQQESRALFGVKNEGEPHRIHITTDAGDTWVEMMEGIDSTGASGGVFAMRNDNVLVEGHEYILYRLTNNASAAHRTVESASVQVHPNPVTDVARIVVVVARRSVIELQVFNGRRKLVGGHQLSHGASSFSLDVSRMPAGMYRVRFLLDALGAALGTSFVVAR